MQSAEAQLRLKTVVYSGQNIGSQLQIFGMVDDSSLSYNFVASHGETQNRTRTILQTLRMPDDLNQDWSVMIYGRLIERDLHQDIGEPVTGFIRIPGPINSLSGGELTLTHTAEETHGANQGNVAQVQLTYELQILGPVLDLDLRLKDHVNGTTLTPFSIPAFSGSETEDHVLFEIEVITEDRTLDSLKVEILDGETLIFGESLEGDYLSAGSHEWKWDGFDNNDILDTRILKSENLKLRLTGKIGGFEKTRELRLKGTAFTDPDWLDLDINRASGSVNAEIRIQLNSGSAGNFDAVLPAEALEAGQDAQGIQVYQPITAQTRSFSQLRQQFKDSVADRWGGNVNAYLMSFNVEEQDGDSLTATINYNTNGSRQRSYNSSTFVLPFTCNYNTGFLHKGGEWEYWNDQFSDAQFAYNAAHELGHSILTTYGGPQHSWGHKGSTGIISQSANNNAPTWPGNTDLMQYHSILYPPGQNSENYWNSLRAVEEDRKAFLHIAAVRFSAK